MAQRRHQVADLGGGPQLQAAPVPSDTYVQPARVQDNRRAESFLTSLGAFNQNLGRLAQNMAQTDKEAERELAQRQSNQINMATAEERAEITRTGMIGGEAIANAQVKKMAGAATGSDWARQLKGFLVTQNLGEMDIEAFVHERAAEAMDGVNGDTFVTGGFASYVSDVIGWAEGQRDQQSLQDREKLTRNTTFAYLQTQIADWIEGGAEPEDIHGRVRNYYTEVGAGGDRMLSEEMIDNHVIALANQLVDTHPEHAMAMISLDRTGRDGTSQGPLAASPSHSGQVANIHQRGQRVIVQRESQAQIAGLRQDNFQRVVAGRDQSAFQDFTAPDGTKVTQRQQQEQFLQDLRAAGEAQIEDGSMTGHQLRRSVATYASRMNIDDPFIKDELNGIERRFSTMDVANNPDQLRELEARMAQIKDYKENNRTFFLSQIDPATRDFFDAFDMHKRYMGDSTPSALEFANRVAMPDEASRQNLARVRDDIQTTVQSRLRGWNPFGGQSQSYSNAYGAQIQHLAGLLIVSGMNTDMAIDAATERVFEETIAYQGDPLIGMEKLNLPDDFQTILEGFADDYTTMDARGQTFDGAVTFEHLGHGAIVMRDRENGTYLQDENGANIIFDVNHVRQASNRAAVEREQQAVRDAVEAQERWQGRRQTARRLVDNPGSILRDIDSATADLERGAVDAVVNTGRTFGDFIRETLGINQRR